MSGGRLEARLARKRKRNLAIAENLAIAVLAVLALVLASRIGMLQNTLPGLGSETVTGGYAVGPPISLAGEAPVRLMLQSEAGRYGVEYDQPTVDRLYGGGLSDLLDRSLRVMDAPAPVSEEVWQETINETDAWVFYDFLNDIIFDQQEGHDSGAGRLFLVTGKRGQADQVLFYNDELRRYYSARLRDGVSLPESVTETEPNGARFAFEDQGVSQSLSPNMMVLNTAPDCPVYRAQNPLEGLDEAGWTVLLEALDFNAKAASPYTTVTGSVIREGADTLRVMDDGTLQFHSSESGENRYAALSARDKDLQRKAVEIIDRATASVRGPVRVSCQSIRTLDDGQTELLFCYLLNGARVQMWGEGWAARFLFRDNVVTAYSILTRSFSDAGETCPLLPVRQAAAAAAAMGQRGAELQVTYQDGGGTEVSASWTIREPR